MNCAHNFHMYPLISTIINSLKGHILPPRLKTVPIAYERNSKKSFQNMKQDLVADNLLLYSYSSCSDITFSASNSPNSLYRKSVARG